MDKKIVIVGDSISSGIGSLKINYVDMLEEYLGNGYCIENLALTGTMIDYALKKFDEIISLSPDIVIVFYGNVDAQVRPNTKGKFFQRLPSRYKQGGMLYPRPLYSRKIIKRIFDIFDNYFRKFLYFFVTKFDGFEQWKDIDTFQNEYDLFIKKLCEEEIQVITVSTLYIDDNFFEDSNAEYVKFNKVIQYLAKIYKCNYIDLFSATKETIHKAGWNSIYLLDHFHPNSDGYNMIAKIISDAVVFGKGEYIHAAN